MADNRGDEDNFVAIDMESLQLLESPTDEQSCSPSPRVQTYKNFSRKGSAASSSGVEEILIKSKLAIIVTGDPRTTGAVTPTVGRCRRIVRCSSARLDPRRVVVMFATLSSMGTLVLLYLTLSMVGGEAKAQ